MNSETNALLLAGGKGTRLQPITERICKPSVPFGASHRLIDFPLSNCINSGIETVGVLTRHYSKSPVLSRMFEGLAKKKRFNDGLHTLPEQYVGEYQGTADAVYKRIDFVESFAPKQSLILCADHVYKMDYRKMLDFHRNRKAELTIAVVEVPWSNASRFGILNTDSEGQILEFEEKPEAPKSNLASMGIYIFELSVLKRYLEDDQKDPDSDNDFGKNIIPKMVEDNSRVYAYQFTGYWKDVGTTGDFWQANLDMLPPDPVINLEDPDWPIYASDHLPSAESTHYPQEGIVFSRIGKNAKINGGHIEHSIVSGGVVVGKETEIKK